MLRKDRSKCKLFKTQIYDDLISPFYLFYDSNGTLKSKFGSSSQSLSVNNLSSMTSYIDSAVDEEVWTPAFINATALTTMPYLDGVVNRKPILGINEMFVLGNPSFKNISTQNNVKVGLDWFLNDVLNRDITPDSGILFWYKKRGSRTNPMPIANIASGEWIYSASDFVFKNTYNKEITIPAGQICIKLNHKELQVLPINKTTNTNNQIFRPIYINNNPLGSQNNTYEPSKLNLDNCIDVPTSWNTYDDFNYLNVNGAYYSIHISEGDYFSYTSASGILDYFLSFNLMPTYRTIYNNLLNIVGLTSLSANQAKRLKQLAFVLATGPQNDKVTLNINGFNTTSYISSITSFLSGTDASATNLSIKTICQNVYKEIKDLEQNRVYNTSIIPYKTDISELNNNYCKVPNDIFHQLVSKYGLYLRFAGDDAKITVNKLLKWKETNDTSSSYAGGPNVSIDSRYIYWTQSRDITNEANSAATPNNVGHPFYDQHVQAGPMRIETDLGQQKIYFKTLDAGSEEARVMAEVIKPTQNGRWVAREDNINYLLLPEIKYSMFYKQGGFKILNSTCYIDEPIGEASLYNGKLDNKPIFLDISKLSSRWNSGNNKEYNFSDTDSDEYKKVSLKFKLYNSNDVIKLDGLYIDFLRYKEETLCSCDSFYRELINRSQNHTKAIVTNSFLGIEVTEETLKKIAFSRAGYCGTMYIGRDNKSFVPGISTRFSPPVISYGGYDPSIISELGIRIPGHPTPGEKLPVLDMRNPVYTDEVKCYERTGYVEDATYFSHTGDNTSSEHMIGTTVFGKGFFHPHYGWIPVGHRWYSNFRNKTAVVSYKPNKKSRFVFRGIGFLFDAPNTNRYSSTVSINKAAGITTAEEISIQTGVRHVGSYQSKFSSEYYCDECIPYRGRRNSNGSFTDTQEQIRDNSCDNNYQPKVDYRIYPLKDRISSTQIVSSEDLDYIRIKDIEIKLNFVNFDNIQDIKLTLKYVAGSPPSDTIPSSYYGLVSGAPFNNESDINNYVTSLTNQNPSDTIILLNKEHIKQYGNEFTLRFSDYASPFTYQNPLNKTENGEINYSSLLNAGVADGGVLHPSFKPDGYTDKQAQYYRELLNTYNVCIINNKFRKWYGSPLIGSKFVLEVELVNQYNKTNYGNIPDLHLKNNRTEELLKSNIARNSICNWEIILDTYRADDPTYRKQQRLNINHPTAEHIDYSRTSDVISTTASEYADGYNFLGDFKDRKFLVPPVNINAPHQYLTDFNSCVYPESLYNNWGFSRQESVSLRYVYQAITLFNAGIGAAIGFAASGGLTGGFVGMSLFGAASDLAVRSIVSYYASIRRAALVDSYDKTFYDASYDEYGYGLPDQALVEISVDKGATWYTFDAKIFKYNQYSSPVYKPLNVTYQGAGDTSLTTCSKLSTSIVPSSPSSISPIAVDPDSFSMPESFIFTGQYIKAKELYIRKNIKLLDGKPNILNHSNVFIGQNTYVSDSTVCIELPFVKPFYYLKSSPFGISIPVDIIYYDMSGAGYKNIHTQTLNNIQILNKDNQYNTYLLFNDKTLKEKLEKNIHSKLIVQKSGGAEDLLSVNLMGTGGYLTLASIKALSRNVFVPDYVMPVYGEGAWGRGSASIELWPAKQIVFAEDYNLLDFAIGYSHNRYLGRIKLANNAITSTNQLNIGLFDNINGWPLYKNIEKYNLHKILSDNIQYPYKNINALNSIFSLYTTSVVNDFKNKELPSKGSLKLLDHLVQVDIGKEREGMIEAGCVVEAIYSNQQIEGAICFGGHECNRARLSVSINGVFLFIADLNNSGQGSPPNPPLPNGLGLDPLDRYSSHIITEEEASAIIRANPDSLNIVYSAADDNPIHGNITWIRVVSPSGEEIASTCAADSGLSNKPEQYSDDKYWISIDKYQYGSYSRTTSIKVLNKIEYMCSEPSTQPRLLNCRNVCGMSSTYALSNGISSEGLEWTPSITDPAEVMNVKIKADAFHLIAAGPGGRPTAIYTNVQADKHKAAISAKYPNVTWREIVFNRPDVRMSCGESQRDTVMYIREYYWIASNTNVPTGASNLSVRAADILDATDDILVRFKYNTRKLRHVDNFLQKYTIQPNGGVTYDGRFGTDEMPIKNSFYSWFCNYVNRGTNTLGTMIPPYYMMLNEMIFRGFFGSADGLEIKSNTSKTQYPHEWIPYEYDNSIKCASIDNQLEDVAPIAPSSRPDSIGHRLRCWLLSKLASNPYDKKRIVSKCLSYMQQNGGPGIVPDKKTFDILYKNNDPLLTRIKDLFLGQ